MAIKRKATPVSKVGHTVREGERERETAKCRCQGAFTLSQTKNKTGKLSEEKGRLGCSLRQARDKEEDGAPAGDSAHSRPS